MVNAAFRLSFDTTHDASAIMAALKDAGYSVEVIQESTTITSYLIEDEGAVMLNHDDILNLLPQNDSEGFPHSFLATYFPGLPENFDSLNAFDLWVMLSQSHRQWTVTLTDEREIEELENTFI